MTFPKSQPISNPFEIKPELLISSPVSFPSCLHLIHFFTVLLMSAFCSDDFRSLFKESFSSPGLCGGFKFNILSNTFAADGCSNSSFHVTFCTGAFHSLFKESKCHLEWFRIFGSIKEHTSFIRAKSDCVFDLLLCPPVVKEICLAGSQSAFQGQILRDVLGCATLENTILI